MERQFIVQAGEEFKLKKDLAIAEAETGDILATYTLKKRLMELFLWIFVITYLVTLLGLINLLPIKDIYLGKLLYVFCLQVGASIVLIFQKLWKEPFLKN